MSHRTRITYPGRLGTWPNGEPQSVRDAYDKMLAEQKAAQDKDAKPADGKSGR